MTLKSIFKNTPIVVRIYEFPDNKKCGKIGVEKIDTKIESFEDICEEIEENGDYASKMVIVFDGKNNYEVFDNYGYDINEVFKKYGNKCFKKETE